MRTLGVQFRTSACDVTLSGLELVSKTTDDRKRVWCPPPTPAALPHLCSSTPSSLTHKPVGVSRISELLAPCPPL